MAGHSYFLSLIIHPHGLFLHQIRALLSHDALPRPALVGHAARVDDGAHVHGNGAHGGGDARKRASPEL